MDFKLISEFKKKLVAVKHALTRQITGLKKPVDMGSDVESTFDAKTDETEENIANAGMVETLKRRAHRIDDALTKMDKGTYGICEKCSKEMESQLMEIDPESRYCRACKLTERERRSS